MADLTGTTCPGVGCVVFNVGNQEFIGIQVTGTFSADLAFTGSIDNTNYAALALVPIASTNRVGVTTGTTNGIWTGVIAGLRTVKIALSAYTSGTAVVSASIVK